MITIKKGQTWSVDVLLAVFVFLTIFILFLGITGTMAARQEDRKLKEQSEFISSLVSSEKDFAFVRDNKIDMENLLKLLDLQKQEDGVQKLKEKLTVRNDFCIYFEDAEGNLVPITTASGEMYNGIGSPQALVNDVKCGELAGTIEPEAAAPSGEP